MAGAKGPTPHPQPPADLLQRKLPTIQLKCPWFRIHRSQHGPIYFGQDSRYRFDAPNQVYGVLYVARQPHGAFIETFYPTGTRLISESELAQRCISELGTQQDLKLLDLTDEGLAQIGANGRLCTGDYRLTQQWALELWRHPEAVDGIYYRACHDLSQCCAALFDRSQTVIKVKHTQSCLSNSFELTLADILECYQFALIT